ncbi:hypothetical protein [Rubripirellula reticaptiva]|uniref:hypothetical protein n=1 Tax=Rubripirellula reticaptiva TaxID=2528013 RepID=UPI0011B625F3|nr:hypothetical protein [Rubripirellula reticaptiva]
MITSQITVLTLTSTGEKQVIRLKHMMWATPYRTGGLRIRGHRASTDVRDAIVRFSRWLRTAYTFPVRCPVYLSPHAELTTMHGTTASATFFAPWQPNVEPYIRIATGDYRRPSATRDRDDALASYLHSLAHELVHYWQWIDTGNITERGVIVRATKIVDRYALTTDHP